jgi:hypothetical protein
MPVQYRVAHRYTNTVHLRRYAKQTVANELGLRLELGGELLEQEKDNMGASERRWVSGALGTCFDEQGKEAVL